MSKMSGEYRVCTRCVLDTSVPYIKFDENGVCDYCHAFDTTNAQYPTGPEGAAKLSEIVEKIKVDGKGKEYDCVIGVSGGTDSSYLLYWAKKIVGLRPLAVQCDNGWATETAVQNIKNATQILGIDLHTHVLQWDEFKDLQKAFLLSGVEDADTPTDIAIRGVLYRETAKFNLKYFLVGNNFRTEGKVPIYWSYGDARLITDIQKKYGKKKLKTFPNLTITDQIYYSVIKRIEQVRPLWYMEYIKSDVKELLEKEIGWKYYGGHHYENIFTRWFQGFYLPHKFGYDKRKVEFSALIRSGQMKREDAVSHLEQVQYSPELVKQDSEFLRKKLGFTQAEFDAMLSAPGSTFLEHNSYMNYLLKYGKAIEYIVTLLFSARPQIFNYLDNFRLSRRQS